MREIETESKHPERLTMEQEELADLLITTKTRAKIRKRRLLNGRYSFYEVERDINLFAFAQDEDEFVFKLHENNPAAPLSPDKINLRNLSENVLNKIGEVLAEIVTEETPDFCTGIPEAGTDIAKIYSKASGISYVEGILAKKQKETGREIVGKTKAVKKKKLRIIDDVITKAGTKLEAIKAAEALGYEVTDIMVLINREEGGAEQLAKNCVKFYAVFKHAQLLNYYLRKGYVDKSTYDKVKVYLAISNNE